jgi:hypothetical protein
MLPVRLFSHARSAAVAMEDKAKHYDRHPDRDDPKQIHLQTTDINPIGVIYANIELY